MFLKICFLTVVFGHPILGKPQFITFNDGKIGVNFGGYHAEAGLGGLLTGNFAHGGLSASAGTPYGQKAAAGIGGSLNGETSGGAYAGATAGDGIGAGALLGGNVGSAGNVGFATANSYTNTGVKEISVVDEKPPIAVDATYGNSLLATTTIDKSVSLENTVSGGGVVGGYKYVDSAPQTVTYVQKIKKIHHPHKVFYTEILPQTQTQHTTQIHNIQPTAIGLGKLFNYGLFAKKGIFIGHPHRSIITTSVIQPESVVVPHVVYEKRVIPKVVYEKRIVPEVIVEKKILPQTVVVQKPIVASIHPKAQLNIHKEITIGKNVEAVNSKLTKTDVSAVNIHSNPSTIGAYSVTKQKTGLFDDIFNIPISTLQAVNRLVNNSVGGGNISVQKTVQLH